MRGKKIFALMVVAIIAVFCIVFTILRFEGAWGTEVVEETVVSEPIVVPEEPIPEIAEEPFEEIEDAEVQPESFEIIRRGYVIGDAALNATIGDGSALITFSSNVSSSDMEAFIKDQNALYDLADSGVSYKIVAPGTIVVDYPEETDSSTVLYWLEKLIGNAEEYMEKEEEVVELPVEEETPVVEVPVVPSAPVMLEPVVETTVVEDDIVAVVDVERPEMRVIVSGGVATAIDSAGLDYPSLEIGIGFEVGDIAKIGDVVSMGVRTDFTLDIVPQSIIIFPYPESGFFSFSSYGGIASLDAKLMFDFDIGIGDIYLGAGMGGAIGSPWINRTVNDYLGYGGYSFLYDFFAIATAGMRFDFLPWLSIAIEGDYRFMIGSLKHLLGARIAVVFSF